MKASGKTLWRKLETMIQKLQAKLRLAAAINVGAFVNRRAKVTKTVGRRVDTRYNSSNDRRQNVRIVMLTKLGHRMAKKNLFWIVCIYSLAIFALDSVVSSSVDQRKFIGWFRQL